MKIKASLISLLAAVLMLFSGCTVTGPKNIYLLGKALRDADESFFPDDDAAFCRGSEYWFCYSFSGEDDTVLKLRLDRFGGIERATVCMRRVPEPDLAVFERLCTAAADFLLAPGEASEAADKTGLCRGELYFTETSSECAFDDGDAMFLSTPYSVSFTVSAVRPENRG